MRVLIFMLFLAALASCNSSTMLDRPFNPETYDEDIMFMLQKKQMNQGDVFNLTYALIRYRPYSPYEIQDQTYGEILETARTFRREGLPVQDLLNRNGEQDAIAVTIENEGTAFIRKEGSKTRLEKKLKFAAEYANQSDEKIILLSTTFLFNGPFRDYISSAAYELNCLLEPGQRKRVNFLAEATNIRDNLLYGGAFDIRLLSVDSLLNNLQITTGGVSISRDISSFDNCNFGSARISPVRSYVAKDNFDPEEQVDLNAEGKATAIRWGDAHYLISESDEVRRLRGQ